MTDKEKFEALMQEFRVPLTETPEVELPIDSPEQVFATGFRVGPSDQHPDSETLDGYNGFFADWLFDKEGKFIMTGIWE